MKRRRLAVGLTQRELAEQVGVSNNSVARWERGELGMAKPAQRLLEIILPNDTPSADQHRGARRRMKA